MKNITFFVALLVLVTVAVSGYGQATEYNYDQYPKNKACFDLLVSDFSCPSCSRSDIFNNELPQDLRMDVFSIIRQYDHCSIVDRRRIADLLELGDNEKAIVSLKELSVTQRKEITNITEAERVLFGMLKIEGDGTLLVTLEVSNLLTTEIDAFGRFTIPADKYSSYSKRIDYVEKGVWDLFFENLNREKDSYEVPDKPILTKPVAEFEVSPTNCEVPCEIIVVNNSQNAESYLWDFGDGALSIQADPSHTYRSEGIFEIILKVTAGNQSVSSTKKINVMAAKPEANFRVSSKYCNQLPCEIFFTNHSGNAESYLWDFGDGNTSTEKSPAHKFLKSGNFNVKLTVKNGNQTDYSTQRIEVEEKIVKDPNGEPYEVKKVAGRTWMLDNMTYTTGTTWCYDDSRPNCSFYGKLYNWDAAKAACESLGNGWHLASASEWKALYRSFSNAATFLKDMNIKFGGARHGDAKYRGIEEVGNYWINDVGAFLTFDNNGLKGDVNFWNRGYNGFSCRCVKNQ